MSFDDYDRRLWKANAHKHPTLAVRCECGAPAFPTGGYACSSVARDKYYDARKRMEQRDRRKAEGNPAGKKVVW